MKSTISKHHRLIAFAPTSRGLGFAVMEGETLVNWGLKSAKNGDKNAQSLAHAKELIQFYQPGTLILEDFTDPECRRAGRIQELSTQIMALAAELNVIVSVLLRKEVRKELGVDEAGTKQDVAETLARLFREELADRLPPKRKLWVSQDHRMDIFDAVALAVAFRRRKAKRRDRSNS